MLPIHQCADGTSYVHVSGDLSCDFLVLSGMVHLFLKVDYHIKIKAEIRCSPFCNPSLHLGSLKCTLQKNKIKEWGGKGSNQKPSPRPERGQQPVVVDWRGRGMKNKTEERRIRGQGDALSSGIPPRPSP